MNTPPLYAWMIMLPVIIGWVKLYIDGVPAPLEPGEFRKVNRYLMRME